MRGIEEEKNSICYLLAHTLGIEADGFKLGRQGGRGGAYRQSSQASARPCATAYIQVTTVRIKSTNRRLLRPNFYFNFATAPASAWPRESFSGIVCSNLGVSGRSGRNYHADCPVPPRCYGAPPKCGVNQSMAPFFGSHCGTPVHQKMVPPATSTPSAKAAKFAAHVACSQYGRVVNPITCYHSSESFAISAVSPKLKLLLKGVILHSGQM